jgi:Sulfotransferase family
MKIKNAIIIHGPGRSGTTLLNSILSEHPDVAWISSWNNRFPKWYWLNMFNFLANAKRSTLKLPKPTEAYNFWLHYLAQFNEKNPRFSNLAIKQLRKVLSRIQYMQGKDHLLIKLTGEARDIFMDSVFENPKVIWLDRKPESVVMSYYKQRWGYKNKPDVFEGKPKKELMEEYFAKYKQFREQKKTLERFDFKEMAYEDLVQNPTQFLKELCDFIGISFSSKFQKSISKREFDRDTNQTYAKSLSEEEFDYLSDLVRSL